MDSSGCIVEGTGGALLGPGRTVNDLPDGLSGVARLFADDLKLLTIASNINDVNRDLKSLEEWEEIWLLKFNFNKCKVMHIDFNGNPMNSYILHETVLNETTTERDLGFLMNNSLKWNCNIKSAISKANQRLAWIARNMITRDKDVMLSVYKCLIRPHLEYCVQIWSPVAEHGNWGLFLNWRLSKGG